MLLSISHCFNLHVKWQADHPNRLCALANVCRQKLTLFQFVQQCRQMPNDMSMSTFCRIHIILDNYFRVSILISSGLLLGVVKSYSHWKVWPYQQLTVLALWGRDLASLHCIYLVQQAVLPLSFQSTVGTPPDTRNASLLCNPNKSPLYAALYGLWKHEQIYTEW